MPANEKNEIAIKIAENVQTAKQLEPSKDHTTYYQKQQEQSGRSEWSGGSWGGRGR